MTFSNRLSGRITRSDTHEGIHGIRVEAWSADDPAATRPLGVALTQRDGSYTIEWPRGDDAACCDCPKVYVKLRDRECRLVHDGCLDRRCCEPGKPLRIDLALAPQAVWFHLATPLSWQRIDDPLVPVTVLQEIEDALEMLRAEGLAPSIASLAIARCITPPIEGFDRILASAWGALQGDAQAARRYREIVEALCTAEHACCDEPAPFAAEVARLFDGACDEPEPVDCKEPASCAPCGAGDCDDRACDCGAALIDDDKVILLVAAAVHIACGNQATARRYVEVLLREVARFGTLKALHDAARKALVGDAEAKVHARDVLELLCSRCAPSCCDTGPRNDPCVTRRPLDPCVPCLAEPLARCLHQTIARLCHVPCFHVCDVRPPRACAGEEIVLVGCGFGDRAGDVLFRAQGPHAALPGQIKQWCDDRIVVVVPQGAGCGLSLRLPPVTIDVCGRFLDLRPHGCIDKDFGGTSAEIVRFDIKGHDGHECPLQPGEPLRIRWNTCAADRVRIELIDLGTGGVIAAQDPAAPDGRWDFTATNFSRTVKMRVRITAFGRCQPPQVQRQIDLVFQKRPNLQVQGLEVTQAVQHYRAAQHLTDPADRGPDNSLRLVTNKSAWVRAYVRSGQDPAFDNGQLAGVTGTLKLERRTGGVWSTVATLAQQNVAYTADDSFASYDAERGNINATLNFVVPANLMTGLLRFTVEARGPYAPCAGYVASNTTQVDVNLQQTLNAAFITIGYNGPNAARTGNLVLPAPSLATCQSETSWALRTYPVSGAANVRVAGTFTTTTPIDDPRSCDGCCSPNWTPLLAQVAALVALDGNPGGGWVYYGLIANGIPVNVPGCSNGAAGGVAGQPVTYAHEMGHQFGLPHARCGNAGAGNANYPVYEPYDLPVDPPNTTNWTMASVGEYGLDINDGSIANPNDFEDFMSYCGPRWISKFTYDYLTNRSELSPVVVPSGAAAPRVIVDAPQTFAVDAAIVAPRIHLIGTLAPDGALTVSSVARLDMRYLRGDGRRTDHTAQLIDAEGRVLAEDVLYAYDSDGCCGGSPPRTGDCHCKDCEDKRGPVIVKAMLADPAPGACLRIVRRGEVVWERKGAAKPPKLGGVRVTVGKRGELELAWSLEPGSKNDRRDDTEVWVRWRRPDGAWNALTLGLRDGSASLPAETLPSGPIQLELLAHDGFHTVRALTETVTLPPKPPAATIFYPASGTRVYGDRAMHLWGAATAFGSEAIESDAVKWFVDDKLVGTGLDLWVETPAAGRHTVRMEAREGELRTVVASEVEVIAAEGAGAAVN